MENFLYLLFFFCVFQAKILKFEKDLEEKMVTDEQIAKIQLLLNKLHAIND